LAASDVLLFMREAAQKFPNLTGTITEKLLEIFPQIKSAKVMRFTLWILGEFVHTGEDVDNVMTQVKNCLGELPLTESELRKAAGIENESEPNKDSSDAKPSSDKTSSARLVTMDGTYATQSAFSMIQTKKKDDEVPPLRKHLIDGDFFVAASLSSSLTKMVTRVGGSGSISKEEAHTLYASAMFIMTTILRYGTSGLPAKAITADDIDRIKVCIQALAENSDKISHIFTEDCRSALAFMLHEQAEFEAANSSKKKKKDIIVQPDDPIVFNQLISKNDVVNGEDVFELSLSQAVGFSAKKNDSDVSVLIQIKIL